MKYVKHGYIDIEDSDLANLTVLFGGRGIGKTYSVLKHRVENSLKDDHQKFIWMRDSAEVCKKIAAGKSLANPITENEKDIPIITIDKSESNYSFIANKNSEDAKVIGYLMALSTFHNARGINYDDVSVIVWDEFIPEEGAVVKKHQGTIFMNAYETVNRNRELEGKPPVKIIFLSNTNDIYSDVLEVLGVSGIIEDLMYNNKKSFRNRDIWIEFLESKEFYEAKKDTFIYRITTDSKFKDMALNNKFTNSMALIRKKQPLKNAKGLLTVAGTYTLLELPSGALFWKKGRWNNIIDYDMDNDQEALLFRLLFNDKLRLQYVAGQMFFDSIYTQRRILDYARI